MQCRSGAAGRIIGRAQPKTCRGVAVAGSPLRAGLKAASAQSLEFPDSREEAAPLEFAKWISRENLNSNRNTKTVLWSRLTRRAENLRESPTSGAPQNRPVPRS